MGQPLQAIVIGLGSAGDVHPNIGLALALRERGHDVLLVAPSIFRELSEQLGLEFHGLMSDEYFRRTLDDPDLWHPYKSFRVVAQRLILAALRPIYELIAERYVPGRTVVIAPGFAFGARIAQEKLGVPLASVHLQPIMFRSTIEPGCFGFPDLLSLTPRPLRKYYLAAADRLIIDPLLAGETNRFRAELGLPTVSRFFDSWMHSPQCAIGFFPEWFAKPMPDWPPNTFLAGFPLWDASDAHEPSPEVSEFLAAGDPPIVFTAGSAMKQGRRFFEVSADICRRMGKRGLLLTQFPEQLPEKLPSGVRHFSYVPFSSVLPHAAAFVHHGGIGTTAQALAAGVPQLVVPFTHDQPDNAVRIRRLQVGDFVLPIGYRTSRVIRRLERIMDGRTMELCRKWATSLAQHDAIESACSRITQLPVR